MAKIETEAARAVRRVREEKELQRRQRELNRKRPKFYLWYLLIVLSIVYIVDEVSSNMGTFMKSEVVTEFFIRGRGMDLKTGTALLDTMSAPLYATMIIMPFYKALADRFGRKPFLVINTIGMGVGLAVCLVAQAPIVRHGECPGGQPRQAHLRHQIRGAAGRGSDPGAAGPVHGQ